MSEHPSFDAELIGRFGSGDAEAAAELVRRYLPAIRRTVRIHLRDRRLRRLFDSMDICQSVLAGFFVRAAGGLLELAGPEDLSKLLVKMTCNKVIDYARRQGADRRDYRRDQAGLDAAWGAVASDSSPSQHVAWHELLGEFRRRLTPEELRLAELRKQGRGWPEIAAEVGGTSEGLRKQLERAIDRVSQELGLQE